MLSLSEIGRQVAEKSPQLPINVDVEADGIAGFGSVLQIGAVALTGETFNEFLKPSSDDFIQGHDDFNATHGLGREKMYDIGRDPFEVATEFYDWVNRLAVDHQKKTIFVGLNSGFDFAHIDVLFAKAGINPDDNPFGHSSVDIKVMAELFGESWDWNNSKQSQMPNVLLSGEPLTHDALQDARDQEFIFLSILGAQHLAGVRQSLASLISNVNSKK